MSRKIILLFVLAVVACVSGFFVWRALYGENDQQVIERKMGEIFQMMGKTGSEGFVVQLEHARTIAKYFDEVSEIRLPKFHLESKMSRDDIEKNLIKARNWTTSLELKMYEPEYHFQEGEPLRCRVNFTGMVDARTKSSGSFQEGYELEMDWVKKDGEWLVSGVGFTQILNK